MRHENPTDPAMGSALKAGGLLVLAFPLALALGVLDPGAVASAASGDVIETIPLDPPGSCGLAFDEVEGVYYVSNVLEHTIQVFGPESFESPLRIIPPPGGDARGIAMDSLDRTLWVADSILHQVVEMDASGNALRAVAVPRPDVPVDPEDPAGGNYSLVGLAFDPGGDQGKGSLFLTVHAWRLSMLYEMALDGRLLRTFSDPIDPEHVLGTPGADFSLTGGIHLIHEDGRLTAIQVAVAADGGQVNAILDLDPDGRFTGTSYPLENVGGFVTAFLRRPFLDPRSGKEVDAFICISNRPWITVLDAALPVVRELSDLKCSETGTEAVISWTRPQKYDFIEVRTNGETVATLPGDAASWQGAIAPGFHEVTVHAFVALNESRIGPCSIVLGYGQILRSVAIDITIDQNLPPEIAWDGDSTLIVLDPVSGKLIRFDLSLELLGTAALSGKYSVDVIRGISGADEPGTVFVFNETRNSIGKITFSGELVREFPFALPDPEAWIDGMTFFPGQGPGEERLWLHAPWPGELYELDLGGVVLRKMTDPYSTIDGADGDCRFGATAGISAAADSESPELFFWGKTASERWPAGIFRWSPADERIVGGWEMPTDHLMRYGFSVWPAFEHVMTPGGPRIYLLSWAEPRIFELDARPPSLRPPSFLACAQIDRQDRIEIDFENNGPYDRIEITRDRGLIATLDGAATGHIDEEAPPGLHEYAVRGAKGNATSDFAR
jgi:hypothetical protein